MSFYYKVYEFLFYDEFLLTMSPNPSQTPTSYSWTSILLSASPLAETPLLPTSQPDHLPNVALMGSSFQMNLPETPPLYHH